MYKSGNSEGPKCGGGGARGAQGPRMPLPVVDETERDGVPCVAGRRGPALGQDHLEAAFVSIKPHFNLDVVAGRHTVVLRYGRVSNK